MWKKKGRREMGEKNKRNVKEKEVNVKKIKMEGNMREKREKKMW